VSDCVLDASAMVLAVSGKSDAASELRTRMSGVRKHAPHLIDAEVGNVLRRHEREARLSRDESLLALRAPAAGKARTRAVRHSSLPRCSSRQRDYRNETGLTMSA